MNFLFQLLSENVFLVIAFVLFVLAILALVCYVVISVVLAYKRNHIEFGQLRYKACKEVQGDMVDRFTKEYDALKIKLDEMAKTIDEAYANNSVTEQMIYDYEKLDEECRILSGCIKETKREAGRLDKIFAKKYRN